MEKVEVLLLRPLNPADEVTGNCPIEAFLPLEMGFGETYKKQQKFYFQKAFYSVLVTNVEVENTDDNYRWILRRRMIKSHWPIDGNISIGLH